MTRIEFIRSVLKACMKLGGEYHAEKCRRALEKLDVVERELRGLRVESLNNIWYGKIDRVIEELEDEASTPDPIYDDGHSVHRRYPV